MSDGSVFRIKDGRWRGVFQHQGKRKYVYGKTKSEAQRKLREVQRQVEMGASLGTPNQTVEQFLHSWLEGHVQQACRPKTIRGYTETCKNRIIPYVGRYKLAALTVAHVQQMVAALLGKGLSQRTTRGAVIVLKIALNHAVEYGYLFRNPAEKVKVRVERHEFTALTPDQARQFLKSIEGHRLYALYRTAIYLGLRQGELIRLTWDDMDFEKRTLKVKDAKTRAGIRTLPLSSEMVRCLQAHQERLQEERKKPGWKEHNLVFPSSVGTKLNQTNLLHHFKTALGKAGLPMVRFHDLRHTSASLLYEAGVPEATISKLLGHSTINITMDIYTHIRQKTLGDAADQMERFLEDEEDEENEEGEEA